MPIFEQHVVWCDSKNDYPKETCFLKILKLCAQNTITNLDSIVSIIGGGRGLYGHLMSTRILTLIMNKVEK